MNICNLEDLLIQENVLHPRRWTKTKVTCWQKKIVQQLLTCIHNYDDEELMNLWDHFSRVLFVKLDEDIAWNVSKLEFSLKCFYIVNAIQNNQKEKVLNFFQKYGEEMAGNRHWQGWFSIVYCKNPSQDPVFKDFFSKSWQESFNLSLHNFFSIIFASIEPPKLLNYGLERKARVNMQRDLEHLLTEKSKLNEKISQLEGQIQFMKEKNRVLMEYVNAANLSKDSPVTPPGGPPVWAAAKPRNTVPTPLMTRRSSITNNNINNSNVTNESPTVNSVNLN
eukprot:TRINITY_DN2901_c0_g1_i2.p1 TRINITY_DN2901_c0_g1~~TRINITY_DN2901_c0_g1_i2.p1  ORF type:complete len:279 (-),score=41.97 TRINITY_DN2901_c0_g1_i2:23-859(-)